MILTALIIFGGLRSIARFSELAVPFMAVAYLLLAVGIILFNLSELPGVLAMVVKSAFGWHEAAAGGIGAAILNGFKRGLFSNEAGMGSAPNAAASATPYPPHPASQGYVQMAGVFIDTLLICTASAAIILLAGPQEGEGIMLVQNALTSQVGDWGRYFLAVIILFFAFTSIVANYFYAENCLVFLEHNHLAGLLIFRLIVLAMVMFGALASLPFVWNLADVSMGLMAITNLIAILLLSNLAIKLAKDYNAQRKAGKLPTSTPASSRKSSRSSSRASGTTAAPERGAGEASRRSRGASSVLEPVALPPGPVQSGPCRFCVISAPGPS